MMTLPPLRSAAAVALALACISCTDLSVKDCPPVLGQDVNRMRTAAYRTALGNVPGAASRFVETAAMSALAYGHGGTNCPHENAQLPKEDADALNDILQS